MFKSEFLWGSASAAYQIEGAATTNGKGPSIWDEYSSIKGNTFKNTTGEVAIDFYHNYEEDIALMKEQGLKAYRFSVAWSRIIPFSDRKVNEEGVNFYSDVIDELIRNGIEPILTMYHWDLPLYLQKEYNGWENRKILDDFRHYAKVLFEKFGNRVKYWVTMNEQNVFSSLGYLYELHPPKVNDFQKFLNVNHHAFLANAIAINLFRELIPSGSIGPSFGYGPEYAKSENTSDIIATENASEFMSYFWLDVYVKGKYPSYVKSIISQHGYTLPFVGDDAQILMNAKPDFIGLNYYHSCTYQMKSSKEKLIQAGNTVQSEGNIKIFNELFSRVSNSGLKTTDWGWAIDPVGIRIALRRLESRYNLPIMITESGLGAYDKLEENGEIHDEYRIEYIRQHIVEIEKAINEGVNVIGYCTWSFQDLFSWLNGYAKRYGFVYVDRDEENEKELKRYKKDSYYWYQSVIKSNGKNL